MQIIIMGSFAADVPLGPPGRVWWMWEWLGLHEFPFLTEKSLPCRGPAQSQGQQGEPGSGAVGSGRGCPPTHPMDLPWDLIEGILQSKEVVVRFLYCIDPEQQTSRAETWQLPPVSGFLYLASMREFG